MVAGHGGVDNRLGNPGLVPAVQSWDVRVPVQAAGMALHPLHSVPRVWHSSRLCLAEAIWASPGCCWLQNKDKTPWPQDCRS